MDSDSCIFIFHLKTKFINFNFMINKIDSIVEENYFFFIQKLKYFQYKTNLSLFFLMQLRLLLN